MTRCDGRVRAGVFDLDARLAKVRSPPANFDPLFSYFNSRAPTAAIFHLPVATRCSPRSGLIQRAQPRPCTYPFALVDPPKRLTSPMPFMQQIRPHARAITSTHKQTYMHATTPPGTHTNVHTDTTRKHTDAQTRTHRKTRRRTNATHATHTPTHMRTDTNDTTGGHNKCQRTHTSMHKHDMHSNTPAQHLKFGLKHHTGTTHKHAQTRPCGVGGGACPSGSMHVVMLVRLCVCVCVCACLHVVVPHTHTNTTS